MNCLKIQIHYIGDLYKKLKERNAKNNLTLLNEIKEVLSTMSLYLGIQLHQILLKMSKK